MGRYTYIILSSFVGTGSLSSFHKIVASQNSLEKPFLPGEHTMVSKVGHVTHPHDIFSTNINVSTPSCDG